MRKPKIELYWSLMPHQGYEQFVNWRLVGGNGEVMCQSTQGFRGKTDAMRSIYNIADLFVGDAFPLNIRTVGPGRKPK